MLQKLLKLLCKKIPFALPFCWFIRDLLIQRKGFLITPWGFGLSGNKIMASGAFEPQETHLIRNLLVQIDIFINVGANIGYYCCHALSLGKPTIAIEPLHSNLQYLLKNVQFNGWGKQIEVFPVAIGVSQDILSIWGSGTGASLIKGWGENSDQQSMKVPVLTLDRILGKAIVGKKALILIDVEGVEYFVLKGALDALSNTPKPIWIIEITTTEHQPTKIDFNPYFEKTFNLFFEHGYEAFTLEVQPKKINPIEIKKMINQNSNSGVYNFIFTADLNHPLQNKSIES